MYGDVNDLPLSGPRIKVPIDIQQSKGRFYAGSALYVIEREIQPGGDPRRMSDGVYLLKHPSGGLRVAKFLKVIDPDDMDRIKAEKEILERLAEMNSPHINYLHEVSVSSIQLESVSFLTTSLLSRRTGRKVPNTAL